MDKEKLLEKLESTKDEFEKVLAYGLGWRKRDYYCWMSDLMGKLCNAMIELQKAEEKKRRNRPGSIGHRKGKAVARKCQRDIKDLKKNLKTPFCDYQISKPQYNTPPVFYEPDREPVKQWYKKTHPISCSVMYGNCIVT